MAEINLLHRYPKSKRNIPPRSLKTEEDIKISRQYGEEYFDGDRRYGYGGYKYDGRWVPVAQTFVEHWNLKPGDRVLDIGCAKGFLVKDLMQVCPGVEAFGIDISEYGITHCEPEAVGRLHIGDAIKLPFPDNSFKAVICINTLHNLERVDVIRALKEMQRVAALHCYVQVDSYRTPEEEETFLKWVLTAKTHYNTDGWKALFEESKYTGDYYWTIIE